MLCGGEGVGAGVGYGRAESSRMEREGWWLGRWVEFSGRRVGRSFFFGDCTYWDMGDWARALEMGIGMATSVQIGRFSWEGVLLFGYWGGISGPVFLSFFLDGWMDYSD